MNDLISILQTAVSIRNRIQSALAAGAHILPAMPATTAADGTTVPAKPAVPTGQLVTAAGHAHQLAVQIQNHLAAFGADADLLKQAAQMIATPAPNPAMQTSAPVTTNDVETVAAPTPNAQSPAPSA